MKKHFEKKQRKLCVALTGHRREANGFITQPYVPNSTFQQNITPTFFAGLLCRGYV